MQSWVDAPPGTTDDQIARTLGAKGGVATRTRTIVGSTPQSGFEVAVLYTIGTVGLFVVGIIVSAAFAVGTRRQVRTLGLAAANGADPRQVRQLVIAQGAVAGMAGTLTGSLLGIAGLTAVAPHLNRLMGVHVPGIRVLPVDVVALALMAIGTAMLAAYLPARAAGRVPTTAALAGRRPLRPARGGVPVVGSILFVLGLVALGVAVSAPHGPLGSWFRMSASTALLLFGAVLCAPWLVSRLEHVAAGRRGAARLAMRTMARQRARTGPIMAAILAASGAAVATATFATAHTPITPSEASAAETEPLP